MTGFTIPSGQTLTIASGATIANAGTATGFGGNNTPSWTAKTTSGGYQSLTPSTVTLARFNDEVVDTDGAYDPSTNYRFTVPSGKGGKYFVAASIAIWSSHGLTTAYCYIRKNGSTVLFTRSQTDLYGDIHPLSISGVIDLSVSDYVDVALQMTGNGNKYLVGGGASSFS